LVSNWEFLKEVLGSAGIPYGKTYNELVLRLQSLNKGTIANAALAALQLRTTCDPVRVAGLTFEMLVAARERADKKPRARRGIDE
jgi:hypothetical protein